MLFFTRIYYVLEKESGILARFARKKSCTGYYHIIMRGVNRQNIFFDDEDRQQFTNTINRYQEELDVDIVTYCLMTNHVHMLLYSQEDLSVYIKKISASYVYWFNRKYERVGHLFQERYKSEIIDTESYFMTAIRYIIHNPQKAGICAATEYKWSSYPEILSGKGFCNIQKACEIAGGKQALIDFICTENDDECMDINCSSSLSDKNVMAMIVDMSGFENPFEVANLGKLEQAFLFASLKKKGATVRQLSRITGVSRHLIQKY